MRRGWLFGAALGLQLLLLSGVIGVKAYTLQTGTAVLLKVAPVDPWDAFRGDYVRLGYDISRLDATLLPSGERNLRSNRTVYVVLRRGNPFWQAVAVSPARPPTGPGEVALKGRVIYADAQGIGLEYGLESFFVPEGRAPELEAPGARGRLAAEVAVDRFGNSAIRRLLIGDQEVRFQPR